MFYLTAGLLLTFLLLFIPGLIFLRFYHVGEFTKQFTTKIPLVRLLFYMLIPGIVIQSLCAVVYASCIDPTISVSALLEIQKELMNNKHAYGKDTYHFLDHDLPKFGIYTLIVWFICGLTAYLFHKLVRTKRWDLKKPLLRFNNHWYYVFSGEVLQFPKFIHAHHQLQKETISTKDVLLTYADILVNQNGKTQMYTGYVVDYQLNNRNPTELDKILLFDVKKYKLTEEKKFRFEDDYQLKTVPGDIFIIDNKQVVNMNLIYVPAQQVEKKDNDSLNRKLFGSSILLLAISLSIILIFGFNFPRISFLDTYISHASIQKRIITIASINIFLSIISVLLEKKDSFLFPLLYKYSDVKVSSEKDNHYGTLLLISVILLIILVIITFLIE